MFQNDIFVKKFILGPLFTSLSTIIGAIIPTLFILTIGLWLFYRRRKKFLTKYIPIKEKELTSLNELKIKYQKMLDDIFRKIGDEFKIIDNLNLSSEQKSLVLNMIADQRKSLFDIESDIIKVESIISRYKDYNFRHILDDIVDSRFNDLNKRFLKNL